MIKGRVAAVKEWWAKRNAFTAKLREHVAERVRKERHARQAARVIEGLMSKKDRAVLRMLDSYTLSFVPDVQMHLTPIPPANPDASFAFERLRRCLVQEGCEVELKRSYGKYSGTLNLELAVKGLPGLPQVDIRLGALDLGPDCVIETREVEKVVEYQPEVHEHTETETQHVAICTDPVSGDRKEVVI